MAYRWQPPLVLLLGSVLLVSGLEASRNASLPDVGRQVPATAAPLEGVLASALGGRVGAPGRRARNEPVSNEHELRAAWADPERTRIDLDADITLRDCHTGDPIRETPYPMLFDGHRHTIQQACFEKRLLRQDGTGFLDIRRVTLTRGGSDGPGAALTSRGEILLRDVVVRQNLAEEPGGGVFSMRRVTVHDSHINGNLANDDGGGVYARRGGVEVYDSVMSNNLVDGSGGAIGSTGDILVVRSRVDGNTTDGDGGALYTDEDGDVTVIDSLIDGSDADGPGGAIFTLDGDVAVYGSTLLGNRADDRGGAISGEADVLVVNSTVARNLAVAHAGGGIWARGDLTLVNATVTSNYAEGEGGGILAAGRTRLVSSTLTANIASVGADVGSAGRLTSFATIIGPPRTEGVTGDTIPTRRACRVYQATSQGYNFLNDGSCALGGATDMFGDDPGLRALEDDPAGFVLEPLSGSPVAGRIPSGSCRGRLPARVPAGQLLTTYLNWADVLSEDAVGNPRDDGSPCDVGAVQSAPGARGRAALNHPAPGGSAVRGHPVAASSSVGPGSPSRATAAAVSAPSGHGLRARMDAVDRQIFQLRRQARRFGVLESCLRPVGVDQVGDVRHRWGFQYDERDGTGLDLRPALAPHRGGRQSAELRLLDLSTARRCLSAAPDPNGTGAPARATPSASSHPWDTAPRDLRRRLRELEDASDTVEAMTERFDEWESCVSWLPVTEAGDARQDLGFENRSRHLPAIDIDASEWDDPDYQLLALRAGDRPFSGLECSTEPGESVDRRHSRRTDGRDADSLRGSPRQEIRQALRALEEEVEDLVEPVQEITQFDECMYTVGVGQRGGFLYRDRRGERSRRAALSFDMRGHRLPGLNVLAFPGEEPPQIECNEDAGGQETDE